MAKKSKDKDVPPVPLDDTILEDVVRVVKTGVLKSLVLSDTARKRLTDWIAEREDELDTDEGRDPEARKEFRPHVPDLPESEKISIGDLSFETSPEEIRAHTDAGSVEAAAMKSGQDQWAQSPPLFRTRGGDI